MMPPFLRDMKDEVYNDWGDPATDEDIDAFVGIFLNGGFEKPWRDFMLDHEKIVHGWR